MPLSRRLASRLPPRDCPPKPAKDCERSLVRLAAGASAWPRASARRSNRPEAMTPLAVRATASTAARACMAQIVLARIDSGSRQRLGVVPTDAAVARQADHGAGLPSRLQGS